MTTLTPAYGRVYSTKKQVLTDLNCPKDFIFNDISSAYDGKYCSIKDFPGERVKVRYGRGLTKVLVVDCDTGKEVV